MTEHQPQFPQPLELPIDERESPLGLRAQLVRFVITGGLSAIVDFGLLVILMHGFLGFDGLGHGYSSGRHRGLAQLSSELLHSR